MNEPRRLIPFSLPAPEIYARFVHFRTQGLVNPKVGSFRLGSGQSSVGIVNAVELRFDITRDVFEEYRIRRWVDDEEAWQRVGGRFARFDRSGGLDDTPIPFGSNQFRPPDIYDYDSPGILQFELASRSILVRSGVRSDARASEVVRVQNFRDWVEGKRGQDWRSISSYVRWTSVLALAWQSDRARWMPTPMMGASPGRTAIRPAGHNIVLDCQGST